MEKNTFSRAELVQFGNSLLKKHKVESEVHHADIENFTGIIFETDFYVVKNVSSESGEIQSIIRKVDGEVFSIGDRVTNGTPMCGRIKKITTDQTVNNPHGRDATVWTDYSGIGMNLASLVHVPTLPSRFQHGDSVEVNLPGFRIKHAVVIKVHFAKAKVQYDLAIHFRMSRDNSLGFSAGDCSTRIYNVDETILESPSGSLTYG